MNQNLQKDQNEQINPFFGKNKFEKRKEISLMTMIRTIETDRRRMGICTTDNDAEVTCTSGNVFIRIIEENKMNV